MRNTKIKIGNGDLQETGQLSSVSTQAVLGSALYRNVAFMLDYTNLSVTAFLGGKPKELVLTSQEAIHFLPNPAQSTEDDRTFLATVKGESNRLDLERK